MAFGHNIDARKTSKRNHIIDLFRKKGILSKAGAKDLSGYSMDTIINIFNSLSNDGLIIPSEGRQKAKGRKASFFELAHDKRQYLGLTFNQNGIYSTVMSFSSRVMHSSTTKLKTAVSQSAFIKKLERHIDDVISIHDCARNISAIGCSVPGNIDPVSGILHSYTFMPFLKNINFRDMVRKIAPGIPVHIDHNILSMSSYLINDIDLIRDYLRVLFISARSGPANSLIHNGEIISGHGEFGHIRVSDEEMQCICGRKGCLDCYFSYSSFMDILQKNHNVTAETGRHDFSTLSELYRFDSSIRNELNQRLTYFTHALHDLVNATNPDIVILTGELLEVYQDPVQTIRKIIADTFSNTGFVSYINNTEIVFKNFGIDIASNGICLQMIRDDWEYIPL